MKIELVNDEARGAFSVGLEHDTQHTLEVDHHPRQVALRDLDRSGQVVDKRLGVVQAEPHVLADGLDQADVGGVRAGAGDADEFDFGHGQALTERICGAQ